MLMSTIEGSLRSVLKVFSKNRETNVINKTSAGTDNIYPLALSFPFNTHLVYYKTY